MKMIDVARRIKAGIKRPRSDVVDKVEDGSSNVENLEQEAPTLEDIGFTNLNSQFDKRKRVLYNRGREDYFELVINTFLKMKKHNLILVGNPGVGKEAIIEGVAERITKRLVPEALQNREVWKLDVDKFLSGDYTDADISVRMQLLHGILEQLGNVILYLYPMYVIPEYKAVGDFAEAIKGTNTLVIGTLTQEDYRESIGLFDGNDATETIDIVNVIEPRSEEVYNILKFKLRSYTRFHGVKLSRKAFDKCLSEVYRLCVAELNLDMLIDYIDSALTIAKLAGKEELDYQSIFIVQKFQVKEFYQLTHEERMKLAMHEAAHAVVGFAVNHPPKTISIIPDEGYLGINLFEEKYRTMTKSEYVDVVAVYVASLASTKLHEGEENNEGPGDLRLATNKAKNMILFYGMHRNEGTSLGKYQSFVVDGQFLENSMTDAQKAEVSKLVEEIIDLAMKRATSILSEDKNSLAQIKIAEALCKNASLTDEEAKGLYDGTLSVDDLEDANISAIFE